MPIYFGNSIAGTQGASTTTLTITLPTTPANGVTVIAGLSLPTNTNITSVTCADGNSNSYTPTPRSPFIDPQGTTEAIFYLLSAPANASAAITFTWGTGATTAGGFAAQFSGVGRFDFDLSGRVSVGESPLTAPGASTPSGTGELAFGVITNTGSVLTGGVGAGWTGTGAQQDFNTAMSEWQIEPPGTKTTLTPSYSVSAASTDGGLIAWFAPVLVDVGGQALTSVRDSPGILLPRSGQRGIIQ